MKKINEWYFKKQQDTVTTFNTNLELKIKANNEQALRQYCVEIVDHFNTLTDKNNRKVFNVDPPIPDTRTLKTEDLLDLTKALIQAFGDLKPE